MTNTIQLTDEKLKEINTSEKFRNEVANAHGHYTAFPNSEFKHKATCSYPVSYIVNEEQIKEAKALKVIATKKVLKDNKNKLLFVGMGSSYEARYKGDPSNHRIRTEFKAIDGNIYFVEFTRGQGENDCYIDFFIDRTKQKELNNDHNRQSEYYNFNRLEHRKIQYDSETLLNLINLNCNSNFKELIVDNYNILCDGVLCESPKK